MTPETQRTVPAVEILAPAGGPDSLVAAVRCGADAVYLGMGALNARRGAANFEGDAFPEAVRYCHERGVAVFLTLNTLVFDEELPALEQALETACAAGVDALIVQDPAVARLARERAPALPLHASTQMSVHDAPGVRLLAELGVSRVVLARELSRTEIAAIRAETAGGVELECFVHGALCMCVSGQCYLSSVIGGRSGNRGLCAQPCRLPFSAAGREHALSLKDLSLVESVRDLAELGVCALKIEGRMKRPEYVAAAVTACRAALEGRAPDYAALEAVFSRGGFTRGYYDGRRGSAMFGVRRKEDVQSAAPVLKGLAALYKDERPSVPVDFALTLRRGIPSRLRAADRDGNAAEAAGPVPEEARTAPTDAARAAAALSKTGGTPYTVGNIDAGIDEGLMLPAAALNALRREVLERLTALRGAPRPHPYRRDALPVFPPHLPGRQWLRARLSRAEQLTDSLAERVEELTLPVWEFPRLEAGLLARYAGRLLAELPGVLFERRELDEILRQIKQSGVTRAVAGGLGGIGIAREHGLAVHGDYGLNITNSITLDEYARLGLRDVTVSLELELARIRALGGTLPRGMLAYGHLPLMVTRNCPAGDCARCKGFPEMVDRKGNRFFVGCDWQAPRLYNHLPLFLADRLGELRAADFLTLYFTRESPGECARVAELYRVGGVCETPRTRGLYYREVL